MRTLRLWLLLIVLWIGAAIPARAALLTINGTGVIPGTTTLHLYKVSRRST